MSLRKHTTILAGKKPLLLSPEMQHLSQNTGYVFLLLFGTGMLAITYLFARARQYQTTRDGFLLANRNIGTFLGGTTIAASWIWAPALFISTQMAYQSGLAGIFWFTAPNILALVIFAFLGPRIRKLFPEGYTLPQFIKMKLQSDRVHKLFLFPYFFYQLMAVTVQIFAGGHLVALFTGIPVTIVMPILTIIALTYTLISGLEASAVTDFVQLLLVYAIGTIILPWTIQEAGGFSAILDGLGGTAGIQNIFDPGVAFSFGIVTSIGLISGSICDQQYWQRSFAIQREKIVPAFLLGAVLFGIVPIALSFLGFLAANPALDISLPQGIDPSMIGVQAVALFMPKWAMILFVLMLLAGLSSTLDSGLSATSSLWVTDVSKPTTDTEGVRQARYAIIGISALGLLLSLTLVYMPVFGLQQLWWIFNSAAACVVVPTLLSLYWNRLSERGVFWGVLIAFVVGLPLFIYANILNDPLWIVGTSLFIIGITTAFCLLMPKKV